MARVGFGLELDGDARAGSGMVSQWEWNPRDNSHLGRPLAHLGASSSNRRTGIQAWSSFWGGWSLQA